ncbi:MAG: PKD domain-containing protein, partial [Kiritimatiellaeota bacterium]|nr:PKD domain-containing protein [Kiritimatiellota bacterium]
MNIHTPHPTHRLRPPSARPLSALLLSILLLPVWLFAQLDGASSVSAPSPAFRLDARPGGDFGRSLAHGAERIAGAPWDTTAEPDGWQTLSEGTDTAEVCVINSPSVAVEGGRMASDASWGPEAVHVVRNWVAVPGGVTLTIRAGTVVKFTHHTGIWVEDGGEVVIENLPGAPVAFTDIADDSVGGDTDLRTDTVAHGLYSVVKGASGSVTVSTSSLLFGANVAISESSPSAWLDTTIGIGGRIITAGSLPLTYSARWQEKIPSESASVRIGARHNDNTPETLLVSAADAVGVFTWDTSALEEGCHTLTHETLDAASQVVETLATLFYHLPNVVLHGGMLDASEVWGADKVHVVVSMVTVPADMTLTIEPGAVVKFCDGAGITVLSDGVCVALGVTFTHIADDEAGGDTLFDGNATLPKADAYTLSGNIQTDETTTVRWVSTTVSGNLTGSQTWMAGRVYVVTGNLTLQSGAELNILPGAIVKVNAGVSITVNSGATLNAIGTRMQPIVFTSYRDDAWGGRTWSGTGEGNPQPGDWKKITVSGTASFKYASILYAANGTGVDDALLITGGTVTFDCSMIAHAQMYAIGFESGNFYMSNSIIWDAFCAYRHFLRDPVVNSVIYDCSQLSNNNGQTFYNCVIANIATAWDWSGGRGNTYLNCVICNPPGFVGPPGGIGNNGTIWADPCFVNPGAGDFRILEGSPCIDAGDGTVAPALDYYGQPRMDVLGAQATGIPVGNAGPCPDIGIYEYSGITSEPLPDLAVTAVVGSETAEVGGTLTVSYTIENVGVVPINGQHRDAVALVSESTGRTVALGETVVMTTALQPGETQGHTAQFRVPAMDEGDWRVRVTANAERDIYEGVAMANNTLLATNMVSILIPQQMMGGALNVTLGIGESVSYQVTGVPSGGGAFLIAGTADALAAVAAATHVPIPTGVSDWQAVRLPDGTYLLSLPAGISTGSIYLTLANTAGAAQTLTVTGVTESPAIVAVSASRMSGKGRTTFSIYGVGLAGASGVTLRNGTAALSAAAVALLSESEIAVTFTPPAGFPSGVYDLDVSAPGGGATRPGAITVFSNGVGPKLEAKLALPSSVRQGRVNVCYIEYANIGDEDMLAPVFNLSCSSATVMSLSEEGPYSNQPFALVGIGKQYPAGVLKAGEENRVPFFMIAGSSYRVDFNIMGFTPPTMGRDSVYPTWESFSVALSAAATRLNLRGAAVYDLLTIQSHATREGYGFPRLAVSGKLLNTHTLEPMGHAVLQLVDAQTNVVAETTTQGDGYFCFSTLAAGVYGFALLNGIVDADVNVTLAAGDINNLTVWAHPYAVIQGIVLNDQQQPIGRTVIDLIKDGIPAMCVTNGLDGTFAFRNLTDGAYAVVVHAKDAYLGATVTNCVVDLQQPDCNHTLQIILHGGGKLTGSILMADTDQVIERNTTIYLIQTGLPEGERGLSYAAETQGASFTFCGVVPGTYSVNIGNQYCIVEPADAITVAAGENDLLIVRVTGGAPFYASPPFGPVPLTVTFGIDDERLLEGATYAWDFTGDGVMDATDPNPTFTYETSGAYTVRLTVNAADGTSKTYTSENCVTAMDAEEPELQPNVKLMTADSGYTVLDATDTSMTLQMTDGAMALEAGDVLVAVQDRFSGARKIRSVHHHGDRVEVETEDAVITDLFKTLTYSANLAAASGVGDLLTDFFPGLLNSSLFGGGTLGPVVKTEAALGITVTTTKEFAYHIAITVMDSKIQRLYMEYTTQGGVSAEISIGVGAKVEIKKDIPLASIPFLIGIIPAAWEAKCSVGGSFGGEAGATLPIAERKVAHTFGVEYVNGSWPRPISRSVNIPEPLPDGKGFASLGGSVGVGLGTDVFVGASLAGGGVKFAETGISIGPYLSYEHVSKPEDTPDEAKLAAGGELSASITALKFELWSILNIHLGVVSIPLIKVEYPLHTYVGPSPKLFPSFESDGLTVHFDTDTEWNDASECPTTFQWDFGDGAGATGKSVQHKYNTKGQDFATYTVQVTQEYSKYRNKTKKNQITVGKAGCGCNGCAGQSCTCGCGCGGGGGDGGRSLQSSDPNEMTGPLGFGNPDTERFVLPGQWMNYTIYFENQTNATASAQEVWVEHQMSSWLDWATFEMGEVAFHNQVDLELMGKSVGESTVQLNDTSYDVRTTLAVDPVTGTVSWYLRIVDPATPDGWPLDPYAGFLPPNDESFSGEGHVSFRVKLREDAPKGVHLPAKANIKFDYNEWFSTDDFDGSWWNTVMTGLSLDAGEGSVEQNLLMPEGDTYGLLPAASWDGYAFGGWFTEPGGQGQRISSFDAVDGNIATLYAKWTAIPGAVNGKSYKLTVKNGTPASGTYLAGAPVTATANAPGAGQAFANWSGTVSLADPTLSPLTFRMPPANLTLTANYAPQNAIVVSYRIAEGVGLGIVTLSPANGVVALDAKGNRKTVTLTAKPIKDAVFIGWTDEAGNTYPAASIKVNPPASAVYTARFRLKADTLPPSTVTTAFAGGPWADLMVGVPFRAHVSVPDEMRPVKFSAKALPAGLKLNTADGTVSGVPTKAGPYATVFTVTSLANAKATATVSRP